MALRLAWSDPTLEGVKKVKNQRESRKLKKLLGPIGRLANNFENDDINIVQTHVLRVQFSCIFQMNKVYSLTFLVNCCIVCQFLYHMH